jgi:NADH-quinone oxidoreductase subunit C
MEENITIEKLKVQFPQEILGIHAQHGDYTVLVKPGRMLEIARFLKEDPDLQYNFLTDLTAVDYLGREPRFEVVYHFYSLPKNQRIRVKVPLSENHLEIASLTPLWKTANWLERECAEFYGVKFLGHPDPRHLLLYDEFQGYPLRKDYPLKKRQPIVKYRPDAPSRE